MKKTNVMLAAVFLFAFCFFWKEDVKASEGEEYITIKVQASDDNEGLKYAIDSNEESAFSDANEFTIPAGTSHTIYVKDAAGNVTSQTYTPKVQNNTSGTPDESEEQQINIDLELGNNSKAEDYSNYEYLTDTPVEKGNGTVNSKVKTDGSDSAEKVFYTVSTDTGEVFYLVIDQSQSTDNVFLLNTVTLDDLKSLAADGDKSGTQEEAAEDNLLSALKAKNETDETIEDGNAPEGKKKTGSNRIIIVVLLIIGGGAYYYLKVYKKKKDEMMDTMDAMDMEDFETEIEDEEEVDFAVDDEEKERFLNQLIEDEEDEEEDLYHKEPDEYYQEHKQTEAETETVETSDENHSEDEEEFSFDDYDDGEEEEE